MLRDIPTAGPEEEEVPSAPVPTLQSLARRPLTFGNWNWMFDAVSELTRPLTLAPPPPNSDPSGVAIPELPPRTTKKRDTLLSRLAMPFQTQPGPFLPPLQLQKQPRRPSSAMFPNTPLTVDMLMSRKSRRFSAADGQMPTFTVVDRREAVGVSKDDPSMKRDDYGEEW
jgi:hypothetical protein